MSASERIAQSKIWPLNPISTSDDDLLFLGKGNLAELCDRYVRGLAETEHLVKAIRRTTRDFVYDYQHDFCQQILNEDLSGQYPFPSQQRVAQQVTRLRDLIDRAEAKPLCPAFRPDSWWDDLSQPGALVIGFAESRASHHIGSWHFSVGRFCTPSYRTTGMGYSALISYPRDSGYAHRGTYSIDPAFMHRWEYDYLRDHPEYWDVYAQSGWTIHELYNSRELAGIKEGFYNSPLLADRDDV